MLKILITGVGGTLGKAFVKYLKNEYELVCIDNNEWAVAELTNQFPDLDIRLMDFIDYEFTNEDFLIHCAAYKHVGLGEKNPREFIENNIFKTNILFEKTKEAGVGILFISTDKAVEPISVYGQTKSLGEQLAWSYGGSVARLGNIISSSGSVIPIWEEAIKNKQPIKVTDIRMTRYLAEADKIVPELWAGFCLGYKLIIPEMGEPKSIIDILAEILKKHGYQDIKSYTPSVEIIGIQKGEKLEEKLFIEGEKVNAL